MGLPDERSPNNGEELEREVARIYRLLGAETEERRLVGHYEIDVHARVRNGPFRVSYAVECKQYGAGQAVSDTEMEKFVVKLTAAREKGLADKGVFVTTSAFSKNARATAERYGIQCLLLRDLYNQLVDFQSYLEQLVRTFDASDLGRWYVDQTVSEYEDYDALSAVDRGSFMHSPAVQYLDHRFQASQDGRLALLGNFGTGKSSFCLAYRAHLARAALANSAARVPLLVDLRDFRAGLDIQQVIVNTLQRLPGVDASLQVCRELQRLGRFFFLLDGLDEMASRVDRAVINESLQEIDRLRSSGDNRYVVTCRTHFFQESVLDEFLADYDVLYLTEWGAPQVRTYFRKRFGEQGEPKAQRLMSDARISELARTPLLLDILLETGDIDERDINVYGLLTKYTDGWIVKQSKRRGTVMNALQRRRFVLTLASHMYTKNVRKLHFSELYEVAREFCGHRDASRIDHFDADARTCTFITRDSGGNYSFRYQAFSDYFSAGAIGDLIEAGRGTLLSERALSAELIELMSGRGVSADGIVHLQSWAAEFAAEVLASNAVKLLAALGQALPASVRKHHKISDENLTTIDRNDREKIHMFMVESIARYRDPLLEYARGFAGAYLKADAEDVVSDVFAKLWMSIHDGKLKAVDADLDDYLRRNVRNELLDRARAERRGVELSLSDFSEEEIERLVVTVPGPEAALSSRLATIAEVWDSLSDEQRQVVELFLSGQNLQEIAKATNRRRTEVDVLWRSALRLIRSFQHRV